MPGEARGTWVAICLMQYAIKKWKFERDEVGCHMAGEGQQCTRRGFTWVAICLPQCLRSTVHRRKSDPMQEGRDSSSAFCWKHY